MPSIVEGLLLLVAGGIMTLLSVASVADYRGIGSRLDRFGYPGRVGRVMRWPLTSTDTRIVTAISMAAIGLSLMGFGIERLL